MKTTETSRIPAAAACSASERGSIAASGARFAEASSIVKAGETVAIRSAWFGR